MIRQGISTGQLLEKIRDLRTQVTGFAQRIAPNSHPSSPSAKSPRPDEFRPENKSPIQFGIPQASSPPKPVSPPAILKAKESQLGTGESTNLRNVKPLSWAKTHLVESGLALTGELKAWQFRAESGSSDIASILDPEEFRAVVRVADAALRLIPAFPSEPELLEPLALALETILLPLRQKIASWHQMAKEFADLAQMVRAAKTATEPGQKSALAATLVRFSQKTGLLGLWLLPWELIQPSERMHLAEAWLASNQAFGGGIWNMHEAAFAAFMGKAPPVPPFWGSWLAELESTGKPAGPWELCQSIRKEFPDNHPLAEEWIPVEHPGLGILLLMGRTDHGDKSQTCRALAWGGPSHTDNPGKAILLTAQDLSAIRDLQPARLRSLLARMMLSGSQP